MLLGCIGDDFTGSSDLANTLAKGGMRVVQYVGVPEQSVDPGVDAGVIALKSRSIPVRDAVAQSLHAMKWLQSQGCRQFFFKYCSTFDSTKEGNIGPVAEALARELDARKVIVCPAFPGTGRRLYQGHLFVGDRLLNESGMQNHPLTPMIDADIRRWLRYQTELSVGHVDAETVLSGPDAIADAFRREDEEGNVLLVVDAMRDEDLNAIGTAAANLPLITGGSGIALGLPDNFRRSGDLNESGSEWKGEAGPCAILSGSCSNATRAQVSRHAADHPAMEIRADDVIAGNLTAEAVSGWLLQQDGLPLAFSSADPAVVADVQARHGREASSEALEGFFAEVARRLVAGGVRRLISAGGETSGAVVEGLHLTSLEIGPEIDPGVPALRAADDLVIALKSGNFGGPDFFAKAAGLLSA
ncbi:MAG: 3-oxo-tetronate kinase [Pseudomonadota bacterium]